MRAPFLLLALISVFTPPQAQTRPPAGSPTATVIALPYFDGAHAIWGATGQDSQGHIWFGVTTGGITPNSAHLFEYAARIRTVHRSR